MYLYVRQNRLTDLGTGLEWVERARARLEHLFGNGVSSWRNVYSPGAELVSFASWWSELSTLEEAASALRDDQEYRGIIQDGRAFVEGQTDDALLRLTYGELLSAQPRYLHIINAKCAAGHLDTAIASGIELARKSEELIGTPTQFVRALTGSFGLVAWLTGYDTMADFQTALEKLLTGSSSWLYYRDQHHEAFESSSMTLSLRERLSASGPRRRSRSNALCLLAGQGAPPRQFGSGTALRGVRHDGEGLRAHRPEEPGAVDAAEYRVLVASEQQASWHPVAQHHPHDGGHSGQDGRDYGMAAASKRTPSTSSAATMAKKPNTCSGAAISATPGSGTTPSAAQARR